MPSTSSSSSDTCSSRHFSWLMKSCFRDPHHPSPHSVTVPAATAAVVVASISSLPDDLILECLARVPHSSLPSVPFVCRRWAHLLNSPAFQLLRLRHHLVGSTLFSLSISSSALFTATIRLDSADCPSWKVSSFVLSGDGDGSAFGSGSGFSLFSHFRSVSIGRKIYVIGRTAMLRCDTWTGTLVPKQGMCLQRKKFAAAAVAGKIYVAGGSARRSAVEEYDPEENVWRVVSEAPRRRYGCIGASVDGVFYVVGGLKIGASVNDGGAVGTEATHVYASSMDLYDVSARAWLRSRTVPGGGCVVAACSANDDVYILSSHAVELSFWKFNGCRKSKAFGEWRRLQCPPVPPQVRVDSTVRFSFVGVAEKVVLVQVVGCIDDLLRRSGRSERGFRERLVLVYDIADEEWSRAADMPEVIRRAACVCVDC